MARNTTALNPTQVQSAKPKDKEYNLADGKGLQLRIKPNGSKLWIFNYTHPHTNKRKNIGLGSYPDVSLADARAKRDEYRKLVAAKIDPKAHRDGEKAQQKRAADNTFKAVAEDWLKLHATKVSAGTIDNIQKSLEKDVFPLVGSIPISHIDAPTGLAVIKSIVNRGSNEIARKVARRMNSVMTFAVNTGATKYNPLAGIKEAIPATRVAHQPALPPAELPKLMKAISYSTAKVTTRTLIEFQLHTMTRPAEAAEAEWSEFDFDNRVWVIPAERMKMSKAHTIPLTDEVLGLLEIMRPLSGHRRYVFTSHIDPKKPVSVQTANKALRDMGFVGKQTAHGLRSLASTTLNEQRFDYDVIEAALAHKDDDNVRAAYNRAEYLERRKVMMQWWSEHIENAKSGKTTSTQTVKTLKLVN